MAEFEALYCPSYSELPEIYRRDSRSWEQIQDYMGMVDSLCRQYLNDLIEFPLWMSPAALDLFPPGSSFTQSARKIAEQQNAALDEVARWMAFDFPQHEIWQINRSDNVQQCRQVLERKADLLRRLPKLFRERGTPKGFLAFFCFCFGLDPRSENECPILIEHFNYRGTGPDSDEKRPRNKTPEIRSGDPIGVKCEREKKDRVDDGFAWRCTMLLPQHEVFDSWSKYKTIIHWIHRNKPAHVLIDTYLVTASFWPTLIGDLLPSESRLAEILRQVRMNVDKQEALHLRAKSQLSSGVQEIELGRLPGTSQNRDLDEKNG